MVWQLLLRQGRHPGTQQQQAGQLRLLLLLRAQQFRGLRKRWMMS